jgi:hypothetical protein
MNLLDLCGGPTTVGGHDRQGTHQEVVTIKGVCFPKGTIEVVGLRGAPGVSRDQADSGNRSMFCSTQLRRWESGAQASLPSGVRLYSTRGGTSA